MKLSTFIKVGIPLIIVVTFGITLFLSLIGMNNLNKHMYEELANFKAKSVNQKVMDLNELSDEFARNFSSDYATLWSLSLNDYDGLIDNGQSVFERYKQNSYVDGVNFYTSNGKYYASIGLNKKNSESKIVKEVLKEQKKSEQLSMTHKDWH